MSTNSAGSVPAGNDGQTDMGRGSNVKFPFSKGQRDTGKVGTPKVIANPGTVDGNKTTSSDPRLA
jgi:hypothetical protein